MVRPIHVIVEANAKCPHCGSRDNYLACFEELLLKDKAGLPVAVDVKCIACQKVFTIEFGEEKPLC